MPICFIADRGKDTADCLPSSCNQKVRQTKDHRQVIPSSNAVLGGIDAILVKKEALHKKRP